MECWLYNRKLGVHKLVYKALLRLAWKTALHWLQTTYPEKQHVLITLLTSAGPTNETRAETVTGHLQSDSRQQILNLFEVYMHMRDCEGDDLATFWMSYVGMVNIVLGLIRAARKGIRHRDLKFVQAMIPRLFSYDWMNYAR